MSDEIKKNTNTEKAGNNEVESKDEEVKKDAGVKVEAKEDTEKMEEKVKSEEVKAEKEKKVELKTEVVKEEEEKKAVEEGKITEEAEIKEENTEVKSESKSFTGNLNFYSDIRNDLPVLRSGDIIIVSYRVVEGGKERIQIFEGTIIAMKNSGIAKTITVRKTSFGISIERIFPLNSKLVQKIEVKKHSKVKRAKLYYLRKLKGKAARLKELR